MIKIFLTVRNRLAITKKCIQAIHKHSTMPYQLYVYNNQTNYKLDEHFEYFYDLFKQNKITKLVFNTDASVYNAFSKASACNDFGLTHQQDPNKKDYSFLLMLDNDIILTPGWDKKIMMAWRYIDRFKLNSIKVVGQLPGGIKNRKESYNITDKIKGRAGKLGGSGLWAVRSNFFEDVGFLDLRQLVGQDKRHDQLYWKLLERASRGNSYILGLNQKIGIHCGSMVGSVCNKLTKNRSLSREEKLKKIHFEGPEEKVEDYDFDEFYNMIYNDQKLYNDW